MGKTNYSVARVVTYTKQSIGKAERHNERKNTNYSNMNVNLEQTKNNVHYKTCNTTYNERLKELVDTGKISLRGLKDNAKIFDELVLDINSDYFEKIRCVFQIRKYEQQSRGLDGLIRQALSIYYEK